MDQNFLICLSVKDDHNFYSEAFNLVVSRDQNAHYSDVFEFLNLKNELK